MFDRPWKSMLAIKFGRSGTPSEVESWNQPHRGCGCVHDRHDCGHEHTQCYFVVVSAWCCTRTRMNTRETSCKNTVRH
jgi:hypothetical protein